MFLSTEDRSGHFKDSVYPPETSPIAMPTYAERFLWGVKKTCKPGVAREMKGAMDGYDFRDTHRMWSSWHCFKARHSYAELSIGTLCVFDEDVGHLLRELIQANIQSIFACSLQGIYMQSIVFELQLTGNKFIVRPMDKSYSLSHGNEKEVLIILCTEYSWE